MGKLLLGIIAVICLDLGFVAFMAADRNRESAMMIVNNVEETDLARDLMVAPASLSVYDQPVEMPTGETVARPRVVYIPVVVNRTPGSSLPARVIRKEREYKTYSAPMPWPEARVMSARYVESAPKKSAEKLEAERRDLIYELATMKSKKSQKRSFVASAVVPVVKKPWDFLKAVGGKFK